MEVEDEASNGRETSTVCNSVAGKVRRCIIHMYSEEMYNTHVQ